MFVGGGDGGQPGRSGGGHPKGKKAREALSRRMAEKVQGSEHPIGKIA